jgi:uncharacterized Zn-binding protein involved in type VI secretion
MGKPAARLTDMHVCPMVTPGLPPIPHVGGPIIGPGCPTVLIGGMPAAVMGDMCVCVGPPDTIILGSTGVFIGNKPAARMGDSCAHGGTIVLGFPTVMIGETSSGGAGGADSQMLVAQSAINMSAAYATKLSRVQALLKGAEEGAMFVHRHTEDECKVQYQVFSENEEPAKDVRYEIKTSDGKTVKGKTDSSGMTQQLTGYTEGMCSVSFLD